MRNPLVEANKALFGQVNKVREWHKLPRPLALLNLRAFRDELRELNLYDTEPSPEGNGAPPAEALEELPKYRTYDGSRYDPANPRMGMAGARFGRNHPLGITVPEEPPKLMTPSPRAVSTKLLVRDSFKPATTACRPSAGQCAASAGAGAPPFRRAPPWRSRARGPGCRSPGGWRRQ